MARHTVLPIAFLLMSLAGCQRPQGVRDVARLSLPVVVRIQKDGGALEERMAVQRSIFQARAAALGARESDARVQAAAIERDWRLAGADGRARTLAVTRENDTNLLTEPLSDLRAPVAAAVMPDPIDLSGLKKAIASLDRLKGRDRATFGDLLTFAASVNAELEKLEKQAPDKTEPQ